MPRPAIVDMYHLWPFPLVLFSLLSPASASFFCFFGLGLLKLFFLHLLFLLTCPASLPPPPFTLSLLSSFLIVSARVSPTPCSCRSFPTHNLPSLLTSPASLQWPNTPCALPPCTAVLSFSSPALSTLPAWHSLAPRRQVFSLFSLPSPVCWFPFQGSSPALTLTCIPSYARTVVSSSAFHMSYLYRFTEPSMLPHFLHFFVCFLLQFVPPSSELASVRSITVFVRNRPGPLSAFSLAFFFDVRFAFFGFPSLPRTLPCFSLTLPSPTIFFSPTPPRTAKYLASHLHQRTHPCPLRGSAVAPLFFSLHPTPACLFSFVVPHSCRPYPTCAFSPFLPRPPCGYSLHSFVSPRYFSFAPTCLSQEHDFCPEQPSRALSFRTPTHTLLTYRLHSCQWFYPAQFIVPSLSVSLYIQLSPPEPPRCSPPPLFLSTPIHSLRQPLALRASSFGLGFLVSFPCMVSCISSSASSIHALSQLAFANFSRTPL